jgi:alkyldihydroxyacetonephosphate synthase
VAAARDTAMAAEDMRWWGWGDPDHPPALPGHAIGLLRDEVGMADEPRLPVSLEQVRLPTPALSRTAQRGLGDAVGAARILADHQVRVVHAAGKSYPDLVRQRAGTPESAPDAVVFPESHDHVAAVLAACARLRVAVVPFGGGTSVVGGVAPLRGRHHAVIALDLRKLTGLLDVDRESLLVRVAAGTRGPALEAALAAHRLTLGHFPQSFEYVTIGGCAATRSAGQASTGYGRIDELVRGLRLASPASQLDLAAHPASAAGPDLRELVVGSEGTLGVITEVTLKVRPRPAETHYESLFFETFEQGAQALRLVAQERRAPDVARLSDEEETRLSMALAGPGGFKGRLGRGYIGARGYSGGCLGIFAWEGEPDDVRQRSGDTLTLLRRAGGLPLGSSPGRAWAAGRFAAPYLRDDMLSLGVMVETVETAGRWSGLLELRDLVAAAIRRSLGERGTDPLVMCHISHLYESGASLYFTVIARQHDGHEIDQWQSVKSAATDAIIAGRGTLTHHHGVGRDHAPWLEQEIGRTGIDVLRGLKGRLDPSGVMNPGKLAG